MFEFYACSCLASFKSNRKNKNQQTEWRRTVKTISWKQIPSVILRVNGHPDYYWSESKIAERATITKVTGIMQFYDECQPDYIKVCVDNLQYWKQRQRKLYGQIFGLNINSFCNCSLQIKDFWPPTYTVSIVKTLNVIQTLLQC